MEQWPHLETHCSINIFSKSKALKTWSSMCLCWIQGPTIKAVTQPPRVTFPGLCGSASLSFSWLAIECFYPILHFVSIYASPRGRTKGWQGGCIRYFPHCYDQIPDQKQLKEGTGCLVLQFRNGNGYSEPGEVGGNGVVTWSQSQEALSNPEVGLGGWEGVKAFKPEDSATSFLQQGSTCQRVHNLPKQPYKMEVFKT